MNKALWSMGIMLLLISSYVSAEWWGFDNHIITQSKGITYLNLSLENLNSSDFWDDLDTPSDLGINGTFNQSLTDTIYVPYIGATSDVDLGDYNFSLGVLNASDNQDTINILGRAKVGGISDYAIFSHYDMFNINDFALLQENGGDTYINAPTDKFIYFSINGIQKMRLNNDGFSFNYVPLLFGQWGSEDVEINRSRARTLVMGSDYGNVMLEISGDLNVSGNIIGNGSQITDITCEASNPFDQDLNMSDSPEFLSLNLTDANLEHALINIVNSTGDVVSELSSSEEGDTWWITDSNFMGLPPNLGLGIGQYGSIFPSEDLDGDSPDASLMYDWNVTKSLYVTNNLTVNNLCLGGTCRTTFPTASSSGIQYMYFDSGALSLTADNMRLGAGIGCATAIDDCERLMPVNTTIIDMYCNMKDNSGTDDSNFTFVDDDVLTTLNCDTSTTTTCNTLGNSLNVLAGSLVTIDHEEVAGTTQGHGTCTVSYTID